MDTNATKPTAPDWALIERDYRAGVKALRAIAEENGITHAAISKRAKRDTWERNLNPRIQARAEALVAKEVTRQKHVHATERQVVEAAASDVATVRLRHRAYLDRLSSLCDGLTKELETENQKAEKERVALTVRTKTMKTLVDAAGTLIGLQREAYGIKVEPARDENLASLATSELMKLRKDLTGA
ncbi:hypothetical protein VLK31_07100 [Variovorax sp. H27-G14]|uniref:hypothetical protein n=1 Tax=Variovorax sp. H27-G14 TaxID=3111914 RepID=UPI0038FC791F